MKKVSKFMTMTFIAVIVIFATACTKTEQSSPSIPDNTVNNLKVVSISSIDPSQFDLIAGKNDIAGNVSFEEVATGLQVTYTVTGGWELNTVHFWIGDDETAYPGYPKKCPPGQFPYKYENLGWVTDPYSFIIPTDDLLYFCDGLPIYVLCHADLRLQTGVDEEGNPIYQTETGWSEGTPTGANWSMMSDFIVEQVLTVTDPPPVCEPNTVDLASAITESTNLTLSYWLGDTELQSSTVSVSGTYTIKGVSPMGCTIQEDVVVTINPLPIFTVHDLNLDCVSGSVDLFTAIDENIINVDTWTYYDGDGELESSIVTITGNYTITGTSTEGCEVSKTVEVGECLDGGDDPDPEDDVCYAILSSDGETAFGGETAGEGNAWWFYYDTNIGGSQIIWAGQSYNAGTVTVIDGAVTITLNPGTMLTTDSESVKIKGYNVIPDTRPVAGLFVGEGTYKGTSLTPPDIGVYNFYVIHLDLATVAYVVPCE